MTDPDFIRGLLAYLHYWQTQTTTLDDAKIKALHPEMPNLLHTVEMGLVLPETTVATAVLIRQCFFLFEGTSRMGDWQTLLQRALSALPPDAADLQFRLSLQLGQLQRSAGLYETAVTTLQQAYALAQESGDARSIAESHLNLGQTYQMLGQLQLAREHAQEALARQTAVPPRLQILMEQLLGQIALRQGDLSEARHYFKRIIALPNVDSALLANVCNTLGNSYHHKDGYEEAIIYYQQGLTAMENVPFHQEKLFLMLNLGGVYYALADLSQAEAIFREMERLLLPQPGFLFFKALLYNNLGNVLREQQQFIVAENYYQQSVAWYEQIEDNLYLANAQGNLGLLYKMMERIPEAIIAYQKAYALTQLYPEHSHAQQWGQSYQEALSALHGVNEDTSQPDGAG